MRQSHPQGIVFTQTILTRLQWISFGQYSLEIVTRCFILVVMLAGSFLRRWKKTKKKLMMSMPLTCKISTSLQPELVALFVGLSRNRSYSIYSNEWRERHRSRLYSAAKDCRIIIKGGVLIFAPLFISHSKKHPTWSNCTPNTSPVLSQSWAEVRDADFTKKLFFLIETPGLVCGKTRLF